MIRRNRGLGTIWKLAASSLVLIGALVMAPPLAGQIGTPVAYQNQGTPDTALQPGDVVQLRIWMEPDLSGEFPVDHTGTVVLPRIGPVSVTNESAESLRARLIGAYGEFLNHTSIEVLLLRRVQVLGAVREPGLYQVDPTMNISDVLALAGGARSDGVMDRVELIRNGQRVANNLSPFTRVGSSPIRSGDQLVVPERSWFARNPGLVIGGVSAILSFTLAILR